MKNLRVIHATTDGHFDHVRDLIRAFVQWHGQRHHDGSGFSDNYFDPQKTEEELAALPGNYAPPRGRFLLALYNDQPAGCVALRAFDPETCEMKRMFVYEQFHGKGVGRELAAAIIGEARNIGYRSMKLETSFKQVEALALYESMGFTRIPAYHALPAELESRMVFMDLKL